MKLHELPLDILSLLPNYLHSIDDLYALIRTCRAFHYCYEQSSLEIKLRPAFAKRHGQRLFPPHPHLLIAGAARSIADWAISNPEHEIRLQQALQGGIEGLFDFCVEQGRMSLKDLRALTSAKYNLLNPVSRVVDLSIGPLHREQQYAKSGRALADDDGEWWTIMEYPELSLLNHWIYCELFHHCVDAATSTEDHCPQLTLETRGLFLSYCLPDINNNVHKVPPAIFTQMYGYANSPWDEAKPTDQNIACFMMIQELLYKEQGSPFGTLAISDALEGCLFKGYPGDDDDDDDYEPTDDSESTYDSANHPIPRLATRLWHNIILHKPLLCFRLLRCGIVNGIKEELDQLKQKCEMEGVAERYFEDDPNFLDSKDFGRMGSRWRSMERDCRRLWAYGR